MSAEEAVVGRRSVRQFLADDVDPEVVRTILAGASRAASGTNIQPWLVHVVTGEARDRLSEAVIAAAEAGERELEYAYLAPSMDEPYLSRRRKVGYDLFSLYGIARDDYPARQAAALRNFRFFGAPVGLFFTMERSHGLGAWLDSGMFMQNVMILARAHGLETCPQQAWCDYGPVVHRILDIPDNQILLSGMAMGYEDLSATVNQLITERAGPAEFTRWHAARVLRKSS